MELGMVIEMAVAPGMQKNNMNNPTLSQITSLVSALKGEDALSTQFEFDNAGSVLSGITIKQYKYILFLLFSKKMLKLRDLLLSIGLTPKPYENN